LSNFTAGYARWPYNGPCKKELSMTEPTLETIARQLEDGFKTLRRELDDLKRAIRPTTDAASLWLMNRDDDVAAAGREADRLLHQVKTKLPALETRVDDIDRRVTHIERLLTDLNEQARKNLERMDEQDRRRRGEL
jgi:chaperonin cofactor prefoldin